MNNKEAIASLRTLCHTCKLFPKCAYEKPECFKAIDMAISALQAQDAKNSKESSSTHKALDTISRTAAIDALNGQISVTGDINAKAVQNYISMVNQRLHDLPSAQPDNRLEKIADLVEGTIDHFDRDDAMDLLYQIKEVFK